MIWPPHVPSYFNAGHHLGVFLTATYLRARSPEERVVAVDAGALNYSWKEIGDLLYDGAFDVVAVVNDFDNIDDLPRLIRYVRRLCPGARIVTGGRLSTVAPAPFREFDVDAIVTGGDLEPGVHGYLGWLRAQDPEAVPPPGVAVRTESGWREGGPGIRLDPEDWVLPDVSEIPYAAYERMYLRDQNKFCGIPQRRELVVPVARGCPIGCSFCDVPTAQGRPDRRLSVDRTIRYITECFATHDFEYVSFYAPTFTLHRRWTEALCDGLTALGSRYPWKCATAASYLSEELLDGMAASGCVRVSIGVETLDTRGLAALPRRKQNDLARYHELARACERLGIELNCFVVVGLPGTSVAGNERTVQAIRELGARVRPTSYASLERLREAATVEDLRDYNRQLISGADAPAGDDPDRWHDLHGLVFGREDHVTEVMAKIAARAER